MLGNLFHFLFITASAATLVIHVKDGYLQPDNLWIGLKTSELQALVNDKSIFSSVTSDNWADASLIDDSLLRYLELEGDYICDAPLRLPSLFVLKLFGSITDAPTLSNNFPKWSALVMIDDVSYTAVDGGIINASVCSTTDIQAVTMTNSTYCSIRNIRASAWSDAMVGVTGGKHNEITNCDIGGYEGRVVNSTRIDRGIWSLAHSHGYIHGNYIHHVTAYGIDFDAYTTNSIAFNNTCNDNGKILEI